ncbi:MAG: hypothetical protein NT141_00300 [candidate division WWE3 bacterium]|nr:hypothetical protein [candidate division WWE3 bacterium]
MDNSDIVLVLPVRPEDPESLESLLSKVRKDDRWWAFAALIWSVGIRHRSRETNNLVLANRVDPERAVHVVTVGQLQEATMTGITLFKQNYPYSWTIIKKDITDLIVKAVKNLVDSDSRLNSEQRSAICSELRAAVNGKLSMATAD